MRPEARPVEFTNGHFYGKKKVDIVHRYKLTPDSYGRKNMNIYDSCSNKWHLEKRDMHI